MLVALVSMFSAAEAEAATLRLWLEAQVEDGQESIWKIYLYGHEDSGSGEMTCTYGAAKYEGEWRAQRGAGGAKEYVISIPENKAPQFIVDGDDKVRLISGAIISNGDDAEFIIKTSGGLDGPCVPYTTTGGEIYTHTFYCELID